MSGWVSESSHSPDLRFTIYDFQFSISAFYFLLSAFDFEDEDEEEDEDETHPLTLRHSDAAAF